MHLAPRRDSHDMADSNPTATFGYVARELGKRKIAFICAREAVGEDSLGPLLKKEFGGVYIANEKLDKQTAQQMLDAGTADAIAFGKAFISNPDLPRRLQLDAPLNPWKAETFYHPSADGYTDYPSLDEAKSA
jgi:2,4-dienoyl-CoA reductase-like NADH-dependent reductase (Old Yellow Enzyme family)